MCLWYFLVILTNFLFDPGFVAWFFVTITSLRKGELPTELLYYTIANAENLVFVVWDQVNLLSSGEGVVMTIISF